MIRDIVSPAAAPTPVPVADIRGAGRWLPRAALAVILCAVLAACGGPAIRDIFYALEADAGAAPAARPIPGTVRVSPLTGRGFVAGTRIVYRTAEEPLRVQRYAEHLWAEVPAAAVAGELLAALRRARVFENAVGAGDPARASYLLSGELNRFEHHPTAPRPHVAVTLTLVLVDADNRRLVVSKTYAETEPTPRGADGLMRPEIMIDAFNRATGRIIDAAISDIRSVAARTGRV
jgi:cholesterol transport system auxiliary component